MKMKYAKTVAPECFSGTRVQVLDLETTAPASDDGSFPHWSLHRIVCGSVLTAVAPQRDDDEWRFSLETADFANERMGARDLLGLLDDRAELVTWNGRGFDLPLLQLTLARVGMFSDNLVRTAWLAPRWSGRHADLLELFGRFGGAGKPSLANIARGLGLPVKTQGSGSTVSDLLAAGGREQVSMYCEEDVAVSWLCWLHYFAFREGNDRQLVDPAAAFDQWLANDKRGRLSHLAHLRETPLLRRARHASETLALMRRADQERSAIKRAEMQAKFVPAN